MNNYDLVVVGGGPGGLMAAKTAAAEGLKVLLLEKKREITQISRACSQIFLTSWVCPDCYIEPVEVVPGPAQSRLVFPGPGFSIDYRGPLKPYRNGVWISPDGHRLDFYQNEIFGYHYDKEIFLEGLLSDALSAGVEVISGCAGTAAENTPTGVRIFARQGESTRTFEARRAIAADGINSRIVESLGLNRQRRVLIPRAKGTYYTLEGVTPDVQEHETAYITIKVPGKQIERIGSFLMTHATGGTKCVSEHYLELAKTPRYSGWFRDAHVVKKTAFSASVRTPLREPVAGNVLVIGDAGAILATMIQGAVACGYLGARATIAELDGKPGYADYTHWWQRAFYFNDPGYFKRMLTHHGILETWTAADMDYVTQFFQGQRVMPTLELAKHPELIRNDNPDLYTRTIRSLDGLMRRLEPFLAMYPEGSEIYPSPDAYLSRWPSTIGNE